MKKLKKEIKKFLICLCLVLSVFLLCSCVKSTATKLEISTDKQTLNIGETLKISVETDGDASEIIWTSSSDAIATVDGGVVSAHQVGEVTIKATLNDLVCEIMLTVLTTEPIKPTPEPNKTTTTLKIHYFRYDSDYKTWNIWLWPQGGNGGNITFDKNEDGYLTDDFGAYATIDLSLYEGATYFGILIKDASWNKDIAEDRFFEVPAEAPGGIFDIYLAQGEKTIGLGNDDPNKPTTAHKLINAYFTNTKTIHFTLTANNDPKNVSLLINNEKANITPTITNTTGYFTLPSDVDFSNSYEVTTTFGDATSTLTVNYSGLYSTTAFDKAFKYDGDDLGATVTSSETTFKLWAPVSSKVTLNLYESGTPKSLEEYDDTATDTPYQKIELEKGEKGVWSCVVNQSLHGNYYTYTVQNGTSSSEVVDPYAKTAGINGLRGMIIDFDAINPTGWSYNSRVNNIEKENDAIIYELHIRDLTSHESWNGTEAYRGKFMGFTESGTTYTSKDGITVTTGLDHLAELGITHVQILPFFDQNNYEIDAAFNWGYNPLNYNCLEGSYSTNPFDGTVRVVEFKKLVMALHEKGINVIMDVVYNHVADAGSSNFEKIIPGYFFRTTSTGSYSNGSGCGNETASERSMVQKFILDSTKFLAYEYNLSGYRFDLMELHDVDTMKKVEAQLLEHDSTALVYGEPWDGGDDQIDDSIAAGKVNLSKMNGVGAFNDDLRDAVKGSVFDSKSGGFIQGKVDDKAINQLKYGVSGGIDYPGLNKSYLSYEMAWHTSPLKTINYISAHDNNTLYDKIMLSTTAKQKTDGLVPLMQKQANAIIFTSQGVVFFQGGDEFMRSKPKESGGYDENSYESPDSVNQFRWDLKAQSEQLEVFEYFKGLIQLRKAYPALRLSSASEIKKALTFPELAFDKKGNYNQNVFSYSIKNLDTSDTSWSEMLIIHNTGALNKVTLPDGNWTVLASIDGINLESTTTIKGNRWLRVNETMILIK